MYWHTPSETSCQWYMVKYEIKNKDYLHTNSGGFFCLSQTALYTRRELNIRTPANFLLALASNVHPCRTFLKKYFKATICLPSDWIDVAELYQVSKVTD